MTDAPVLARDLKLEPRAARQLHFRLESQQAIGLKRFDPPEIHRISDAKIDRVATAPPQPDPPTSKSSRPRIRHSQFP